MRLIDARMMLLPYERARNATAVPAPWHAFGVHLWQTRSPMNEHERESKCDGQEHWDQPCLGAQSMLTSGAVGLAIQQGRGEGAGLVLSGHGLALRLIIEWGPPPQNEQVTHEPWAGFRGSSQ
jgi:hypothetical protein